MKDKTESQHILVIYFRVIFYLLRPSFETEGAVLGTACTRKFVQTCECVAQFCEWIPIY